MSVIVNDNDLYFAKIKPNAIIPSKRDEDAGYDVYACFEGDYFVIDSGVTKGVPTGIATAFSKKYYFQVEERGSTAKVGMKKSAGVIDSGYRGEYIIMIYNSNKKTVVISKVPENEMPEEINVNGNVYKKSECVIYPSTKAIAQLVLHEVPVVDEKEISYEELCQISSDRGVGGWGSSKK